MAHAARLSLVLATTFGLVACESLDHCPPSSPPHIPAQAFMVFFDLGSTKVTVTAMATVRQVAAVLGRDGRVVIAAHTDGSGDPMANLVLSFRRGEALRDALAANGIEPSRVEIQAKGDQFPLEQTRAPAPRNRRAEFVITSSASSELPQDFRYEDYRCIAFRSRLVRDK